MSLRTRRTRLTLMLGAIGLLLALAIVAALQPRLANHFGYALPGNDGLPNRIHYGGRDYATNQVCAYAGWCAQDLATYNLPRCYDSSAVHSFAPGGAFAQVATIWTLFGAPQPVLSPPNRGVTSPLIVLDDSNCFVMYSLEGGP